MSTKIHCWSVCRINQHSWLYKCKERSTPFEGVGQPHNVSEIICKLHDAWGIYFVLVLWNIIILVFWSYDFPFNFDFQKKTVVLSLLSPLFLYRTRSCYVIQTKNVTDNQQCHMAQIICMVTAELTYVSFICKIRHSVRKDIRFPWSCFVSVLNAPFLRVLSGCWLNAWRFINLMYVIVKIIF